MKSNFLSTRGAMSLSNLVAMRQKLDQQHYLHQLEHVIVSGQHEIVGLEEVINKISNDKKSTLASKLKNISKHLNSISKIASISECYCRLATNINCAN